MIHPPFTFAHVDKKSRRIDGPMASLQDRIFRHHEASFIPWARAGCPSVPSMAESPLPRLFLRKPGDAASER